MAMSLAVTAVPTAGQGFAIFFVFHDTSDSQNHKN